MSSVICLQSPRLEINKAHPPPPPQHFSPSTPTTTATVATTWAWVSGNSFAAHLGGGVWKIGGWGGKRGRRMHGKGGAGGPEMPRQEYRIWGENLPSFLCSRVTSSTPSALLFFLAGGEARRPLLLTLTDCQCILRTNFNAITVFSFCYYSNESATTNVVTCVFTLHMYVMEERYREK